MENSNHKILLPIKLDFIPHDMIVGDNIVIERVINRNTIAITNSRFKSTAHIKPNRRNGAKLCSYLAKGAVYGRVFAQFTSHILVEVEVETNWFHVCDNRNPQVTENQLND
jgi:hypothetical protein